jgi:NADH dehydrogenase (ubiquinone) Fe-S protein 3
MLVKIDSTINIENIKYINYLSSIFPNDIFFITYFKDQLTIYAKKKTFLKLIHFNKNHVNSQFKNFLDVFAVDLIKYNKAFRFEIIYSFLSVLFCSRLFIKVHTDEFSAIESLCYLFKAAN